MSIFGIKNKPTETNKVVWQIKEAHKQICSLIDENNRIQHLEYLTKEKIRLGDLKNTITITVEMEGGLYSNYIMTTGMGGYIGGQGYEVTRRGNIIGMSISCEKKGGEVQIGVILMPDRKVLKGCEITLSNIESKAHYIFDTPFFIEEGNRIYIASLKNNYQVKYTFVALLFSF